MKHNIQENQEIWAWAEGGGIQLLPPPLETIRVMNNISEFFVVNPIL